MQLAICRVRAILEIIKEEIIRLQHYIYYLKLAFKHAFLQTKNNFVLILLQQSIGNLPYVQNDLELMDQNIIIKLALAM